ncbi:hypothetical protein [Terricaulis sp.]|uniref:hypothetical protein n=1 Tax=Terricaulis sp. TaxID=2768686 RepID=UPI0037844FFC
MSRKRGILVAIGAVLIVVVGGGAYAARGNVAYARVATGYAAKTTCSCLHVSGRALDSCIADFPPEAQRNVSITQDGDEVRASVLGVISSRAVYEEGYGCRIEE